jgi:hypothetical protein
MRYAITHPIRLGTTMALPGDVLVQTDDGWHLVRAVDAAAAVAAITSTPDALAGEPRLRPSLRLLA